MISVHTYMFLRIMVIHKYSRKIKNIIKSALGNYIYMNHDTICMFVYTLNKYLLIIWCSSQLYIRSVRIHEQYLLLDEVDNIID